VTRRGALASLGKRDATRVRRLIEAAPGFRSGESLAAGVDPIALRAPRGPESGRPIQLQIRYMLVLCDQA
jgi:hypothetical protein